MWLERNDVVFNDVKWSREKMIHKVWLRLIDYGCMEWKCTQDKDNRKFESIWYRNGFLAEMVAWRPNWKFAAASNGFDVH